MEPKNPRLLFGGAAPRIWKTKPQLLSNLQYRAKTDRTVFAQDEDAILEELEFLNSIQPDEIQLPHPFLEGLASQAATLPKKSLATGTRRRISKSVGDLKREVTESGAETVEGVLGEGTVALVAGDSGIGKSPLLTQMGLCVASGLPFLNQQVTQGNVLLVDYENGKEDLIRLAETIGAFLGLPEVPENFSILHHPKDVKEVESEILSSQPRLVLIDAVRGFDPKLEDKNSDAGTRLTDLQRLASLTGSSIVLLHHLRKFSDEYPPKPLEEDDIMHWLQQVSGPRALVNQTHTRIAIEAYKSGVRPADLILKGHFKVSGAFGPWYIGRRFNESGEPIGYERLVGVQLLSADHRIKFLALPDTFSFTTASKIYGKSPSAVANWLIRLTEAGLIRKQGFGQTTHYEKITKP